MKWLLDRGTSFVSTFEPPTRPREDHTTPVDDELLALDALVDDNLAEDVDIISLEDTNDSATTRPETLSNGAIHSPNPTMSRLNLDPQATRSPKVPPSLKKSFSDLPVPGTPRQKRYEDLTGFQVGSELGHTSKYETSKSFQDEPRTPRLTEIPDFEEKADTRSDSQCSLILMLCSCLGKLLTEHMVYRHHTHQKTPTTAFSLQTTKSGRNRSC